MASSLGHPWATPTAPTAYTPIPPTRTFCDLLGLGELAQWRHVGLGSVIAFLMNFSGLGKVSYFAFTLGHLHLWGIHTMGHSLRKISWGIAFRGAWRAQYFSAIGDATEKFCSHTLDNP